MALPLTGFSLLGTVTSYLLEHSEMFPLVTGESRYARWGCEGSLSVASVTSLIARARRVPPFYLTAPCMPLPKSHAQYVRVTIFE